MTTSLDAPGHLARPGRRYSASNKTAIAICTLVTVMEGYNLIVYGAVVPSLLADPSMGITPAAAGLVGSMVYVGMLIGAFSAGVLGDRIGRQRVLIVAIALFLLGAVAAAMSVNAQTLSAARILAGLGVGGAVTTALALARGHAPQGRSTLVVTITMAGIPVGGTLASFVGMAVLPVHGWRPMFLIGAGVTAVILAVVVLVRMEQPNRGVVSQAAHTGSAIGELFTRKNIIVTIVIAAAAIPNMFTWFGLNVWLTAVMSELDYPLTSALLFSLTLTSGAIVGSFLTAWWADRWTPERVGALTAAVTVAGLGVVMSGVDSQVILLAAVALMGMGGHSTMNLINAAAANRFPEFMRGTALGWANGISYVGALGPLTAGMLLDLGFGPHSVFALYGTSAAIAAAAMAGFALLPKAHEPGSTDRKGPTHAQAPALVEGMAQ
ncbi:MAG: aromatic acid/H+ symport family MFS transporter [Mycobacterium sp.]